MPSVIKTVTWDCHDALVLARFWAAALGSDVDEDSTSAKAFVEAVGWGAPNMWFNQVPEPKSAKNRLHFDLRAPAEMAAEVGGWRHSAPRSCAAAPRLPSCAIPRAMSSASSRARLPDQARS